MKEVATVFAVSCDEKVVVLKDVFAEEGGSSASARKEGAISRAGLLNSDCAVRDEVNALEICFPFRAFVNFFGFSEPSESSKGRFLVILKETCLLAWGNLCADLEDGDGESDGERPLWLWFISSPVSSSVGDPGSMAVMYDSRDSRSSRRSVRSGWRGCDVLAASICKSVFCNSRGLTLCWHLQNSLF